MLLILPMKLMLDVHVDGRVYSDDHGDGTDDARGGCWCLRSVLAVGTCGQCLQLVPAIGDLKFTVSSRQGHSRLQSQIYELDPTC